jgi:SSS family solute:Na+ symporter
MSIAPVLAVADGESSRMLSLGGVDILIIVIYFVAVLALGFYLKKFADTGEGFFLAGRKMTAWVAGLSFISANLSSLETMGWSAMAYQYGMLGAHAYLIGAIPAILFLAVVMMPFYYLCKTHSVPGYLKLRYGEGARSLAGISFAFMTVMVSGASMFAMAKILHLLLGWDMHMSIWVSSLTVAVYVTLGGLVSAVFNEVLQFFLIWLGSLLIPILGLIQAGGWNKMMAAIQHNVKVIHPNVPSDTFAHLWRDLGTFHNSMGIDWIGMVFGLGVAVSFGYWCTDFLQVQRVIVAKDLRSAQNGTIIGAMLKMCVPLIVTIPGLLGMAVLLHHDGSPIVLVAENDPRAITHMTYNDVLPLLMGKYLGPGLLGLGVTAMIAGFMSGMAGNVSAFATVWTYDVYRPLVYRGGSDRHYLAMGRWASILGVLVSIGTAYTLFWFSNILAYLQVLVFFFIVPLFGVVILGMLWKRATPAAGFWGFLTAILLSVSMWVFVHSFPGGQRPQPKVTLDKGAVVTLEKALVSEPDQPPGAAQTPKIVRVVVQKGTVRTTNVPMELGEVPVMAGELDVQGKALPVPAALDSQGKPVPPPAASEKGETKKENEGKVVPVQLFAPEVVVSGPQEGGGAEPQTVKFGVEAVPVLLKPGVHVVATEQLHYFNPAAYNRDHVKYIARYADAQEMAVNMYSAVWTLICCLVVTVLVSLFTAPKPDKELANLVMGLTPMPDEGRCPWYKHPYLWAGVAFAVLVAINVIFW